MKAISKVTTSDQRVTRGGGGRGKAGGRRREGKRRGYMRRGN